VVFCSLCSFLVDSPETEYYTPTFRNTLCVPKRRHIKFGHRRITQKKEHNFQNKAEVWNQGVVCGNISVFQNIKNGNVIYNCYWEEAFKWCMLRTFSLGFQDFGKIILASNKTGGCRNLHNSFLGDSRYIKYWLGFPAKVKSFGATHRSHVDYESIKTF